MLSSCCFPFPLAALASSGFGSFTGRNSSPPLQQLTKCELGLLKTLRQKRVPTFILKYSNRNSGWTAVGKIGALLRGSRPVRGVLSRKRDHIPGPAGLFLSRITEEAAACKEDKSHRVGNPSPQGESAGSQTRLRIPAPAGGTPKKGYLSKSVSRFFSFQFLLPPAGHRAFDHMFVPCVLSISERAFGFQWTM